MALPSTASNDPDPGVRHSYPPAVNPARPHADQGRSLATPSLISPTGITPAEASQPTTRSPHRYRTSLISAADDHGIWYRGGCAARSETSEQDSYLVIEWATGL